MGGGGGFVFTYTEISMMRFFVMLVMYAHWNACLWGMVAHPDIQPDYNWMFRLEETMNANSVMRCRVSQDHAALQGMDIDASVAYLNSNFDDSASLAGVGTYKPNWAPYCVGSESETCRGGELNIGRTTRLLVSSAMRGIASKETTCCTSTALHCISPYTP